MVVEVLHSWPTPIDTAMTPRPARAFLCNQSCPHPPTITEEHHSQLLYPDQRIALRTTVEPHDPISLAVWNGNKQSRESVAFRAVGGSLLRRIFISHHVVLRSMVFSANLSRTASVPIRGNLSALPEFLSRKAGGESRFSEMADVDARPA